MTAAFGVTPVFDPSLGEPCCVCVPCQNNMFIARERVRLSQGGFHVEVLGGDSPCRKVETWKTAQVQAAHRAEQEARAL